MKAKKIHDEKAKNVPPKNAKQEKRDV